MADDGFNGSTIEVEGGDQTPLQSITHDVTAAEVQTTGAADTAHTFVAGIPNETVTFEIVGGLGTVDVGDEGNQVSIAWFDGSTDLFTTGICTARSTSGSIDSPLITSYTFKRQS